MTFNVNLIHEVHTPLYAQIAHLVKDIEHWREEDRTGLKRNHVAVVVCGDGECFVGTSACYHRDQYDHRVGYDLAVKRALIRCVRYNYSEHHWLEFSPSFLVDSKATGRELYRQVRASEAVNRGWNVPSDFTIGG